MGRHWLPVLLVAGAIFTVVAVTARLGIEWFAGDDEERPPPERPYDRAATHIPRGGG